MRRWRRALRLLQSADLRGVSAGPDKYSAGGRTLHETDINVRLLLLLLLLQLLLQ